MTFISRCVVVVSLALSLAACGGGAGAGDSGGGDSRLDVLASDVPDASVDSADPGREDLVADELPGDVPPPPDAPGDLPADDSVDLPADESADTADDQDLSDEGGDDRQSDVPGLSDVVNPPDVDDIPGADDVPDVGTDAQVPDGIDLPDAFEDTTDVPALDPGPIDPGGPDLSATGLCGTQMLPTWSRKFLGAGGTVTFNEIQYHPAGDSQLEWVELHNPMAVDIDLSGWRLAAGIRYTFAEGTLVPARGFLVMAANPALLAQQTGYAGALGPWDGQLDNGGERLELRNNTGRLMDTVDYDDVEPWPVSPDGSGATLAKRDPDTSSEPAENWATGNPVGGTPGAPNFPDLLAPPSQRRLLPWDADWSWDASGEDPGDGWRQPSFNDSAWGRGPAPFFARATPPAGQGVTARLTAQDGFALYVGRSDGTGLRRVGTDSDGTWNTVEEMPFEVLPGDHVFVAAWEAAGGDPGPQMLIGQFQRADGTTLVTGADGFEWIPGPSNAVPEGGTEDPTPGEGVLQGVIREADLAGTWGVPQAVAGALDEPWGPVVGASFREDARYLWGDTFGDVSTTNALQTFALFRSVQPLVAAEPGSEVPLGATTTRFRARFDLDEDPVVVLPWLDMLLDDGAVVWLNGVEVLRLVMPEGEVTPSTLASWPVDAPQSWTGNLISAGVLVTGVNVLAVEVHQALSPDDDLAFAAELAAQIGSVGDGEAGLRFSEVAGGGSSLFWVELVNAGTTLMNVGGIVIVSSQGSEVVLPGGWLTPGERLLLDPARLGFGAASGDRLFLLSPARTRVLDGVAVMDRPRGRPDPAQDSWWYPDASTPGAANRFQIRDAVVINEIQYHHQPLVPAEGPAQASSEEWIELYNRGADAVDLGGWQLVDDLQYQFPAGTTLPAGGYLVVARDAAALRVDHPAVPILGDFVGSLDNSGGTVLLRDACGNPVDQVRYLDGGRWPSPADGGGSSLELVDPAADNASPEAWAASDTTSATAWETYAYQGIAQPSAVGPDGRWQEFVLGLLDGGVVLLDDISVIEEPDGPIPVELIQDGTFGTGLAAGWRLLGTHRHSQVVPDPDDPGNPVLRLVATGPTEHMHNHAETTLADGRGIVDGRTYRISFRARWVAGSNRLNTRLYFNRLARTTRLTQPEDCGTPGQPNSTNRPNLGPTWDGFSHGPVVPAPLQAVRVQVAASDPDGVEGVTLWVAVDGGEATGVPMTRQDDGRFAAMVPGQPAATIVQFWVEGRDGRGAVSTFPAAGPASRALWKVDDGLASTTGLHDLRIVLTPPDAAWLHGEVNVMSNDPVGATVIYDEREAFYDVGVRLKGSERGRSMPLRTGFSLHFHAEQPFRGTYRSVMVDRSQGVNYGQREMLMNQVMTHSGSVSAEYNDLVQVIPPRLDHTGPAELQMARFGDLLLDTQFEGGGDGLLFDYELVYYPTTTDDGTPEGLKLPQPDLVVGTPIKDLGDDPEAYRYSFLVKNNEWRDDYGPLMAFAKVFGLPQAGFDAAVGDTIDVDQWLRAFAFATLSGAIDNYASGAQHNADFYVRPDDGRVLYFPHDLDFYGGSPRSALVANGDLARLIATPANLRAYYGHLLDIVRTSYNGAYMARWCQHFGALLPGQDFAAYLQFVIDRAAWVLDEAPNAVNTAIPSVPFQITTNGGADFTVPDAAITLQGTGWVDVRQIHRFGDSGPLLVTWVGPTDWLATVPLACGANVIVLVATDPQGSKRGSDMITITSGCP